MTSKYVNNSSVPCRDFPARAIAIVAIAVTGALLLVGWPTNSLAVSPTGATDKEFAREVEQSIPLEKPRDYHKRLTESVVHVARRDPEARAKAGELTLPEQGWKLVWNRRSSQVLTNAVSDFQNYLEKSMQVRVEIDGRDSLEQWREMDQCIVVGTRDQLPGCGTALKGPKDYEIVATPKRLTVCGYDERGAMFGLYNLEARMNLREGPFLPVDLKTVRHSLYDARMVISWLGYWVWPDSMLSHVVHDGFDGIFASVYANPNGDASLGTTSTDPWARYFKRSQDPVKMRDLIDRATRRGLKVYASILYQYMGTPESEAGLRSLVRDILEKFPDIQGYILLTEGFWYKRMGGWGSGETAKEWIRGWNKAVGFVAEECHKRNPAIEILAWDYSIGFTAGNTNMKRYAIQQLPADAIPMPTWENGKSFEFEGIRGSLRDYSLNQIGPAETTDVQIEEARKRGMKVYTKADTFACWQYGSTPYLPFPYQWYDRYKALEKYGINGTLESWSSGYTPNFMTELRAWYCWDDAPPLEELLGAIAARDFGTGGKEMVLKAWNHFSQAIRLVPDTGPSKGTCTAIGNPIFFQEPPLKTEKKTASHNPRWPYTAAWLLFYPDFNNKTNMAERHAIDSSGAWGQKNVLPAFLKSLKQASDQMGEGLKLYRAAALNSPQSKRQRAVREVMVAEHLHRMMQSECAYLEFEDLRFQLVAEKDNQKAGALLDRMEAIVRKETDNTELSLLAASRDSRLGYQPEGGYHYTAQSLKEKLGSLRETIQQLAQYRKKDAR
ncbi:MAG: hypothetical protein PHR77_10505 [Kiritimatiellae bacterium]|nr:hypothetical protein [Kiritimatiellia bacterium]MDD5522100.1 hypothetical protein [Kiritimatiellia bacterium]